MTTEATISHVKHVGTLPGPHVNIWPPQPQRQCKGVAFIGKSSPDRKDVGSAPLHTGKPAGGGGYGSSPLC